MKRGKILVVDDEQDVVELLCMVLSKHGYEPVDARNGMEGLMRAQSEAPDLVLLDIMMEGMDGWEVLKLLQMEENTRDIPVVILSARVEARDKIRGLQEGAVHYLTKPFAVKSVLETIEKVLADQAEE
jgi:DNA-binding response OmpR family regulator